MVMMRNFTAVMPVTCNADCSFCPEKEMEKKASQKEWLNNLIAEIKTRKNFDHISISGGEPTLRMKFMFEVVDRIQSETHIKHVGVTTNGRILDKANDTLQFLHLNTNDALLSKLSFVNVSMHSFDKAVCNDIMKTESTYTLDDLVRFRRLLGPLVSFHINFVITKQNLKNIEWEFQQARELMREYPFMEVVFRVDYNMPKLFEAIHKSAKPTKQTGKRKIPDTPKPRVVKLFEKYFGVISEYDEDEDLSDVEIGFEIDTCPSCYTQRGTSINGGRAWLKASAYEPNKLEPEYTEYVFHMDGKLYYDWSRKAPVPAVRKPRHTRSADSTDIADAARKLIDAAKPEKLSSTKSAPAKKKVLAQKKARQEELQRQQSSVRSSCSFRGTGSCSYR